MFFKKKYEDGDVFLKVKAYKKPLFIIAHQDDELNYAGLIQRLGKNTSGLQMGMDSTLR